MSIERLSGGLTPADGADPRTFPAIWNATADDLEAGDYSRVPTGGSAGQVLVKDSGTDYDASWDFRSFAPTLSSGAFYGGVGNTTTGINNGVAQFSLVYFPKPTIVNAIRCDVTTAGTAGTLVRLGVYAPGANGLPNALIVDAGTAAADTTGVKTITISQTLSGLVYCVAVPQGGNIVMRASNGVNVLYEAGNTVTDFARRTGHEQTGVTGALPGTATITSSNTLASPTCQLRVA
jgi:hypothetical protein